MPLMRSRKPLKPDTPTIAAEGLSGPAATAVYLSPDDKHLAVVTHYEQLTIYRLSAGMLGDRLSTYKIRPLSRASWSSSGTMIAFANDTFRAQVVDLSTGESTVINVTAAAVSFFPHSPQLAIITGARELTIWNADTKRTKSLEMTSGEYTPTKGHTLSVSSDERWVTWGTDDSVVQVLDMEGMRFAHQIANEAGGRITDLEWLGPTP